MSTIDDQALRQVVGGDFGPPMFAPFIPNRFEYYPTAGATPPAAFERVAIWDRSDYVAELNSWIGRH